MGIKWNVEKCAGPLDPNATDALIYGLIPVGIGQITEQNVGEVFARHTLWSKTSDLEPIAREHFDAHIGLWTNVSFREESRFQWFARVIEPRLGELGGYPLIGEDDPPMEFVVRLRMEDGDGEPDGSYIERALRTGIKREWPEEPATLTVEGIDRPW